MPLVMIQSWILWAAGAGVILWYPELEGLSPTAPIVIEARAREVVAIEAPRPWIAERSCSCQGHMDLLQPNFLSLCGCLCYLLLLHQV